MSVFDSDSEVGSIKRGRLPKEEFGDDVSIISRYEGSSPSVVIFKIFLALLLIGACSGALVYSIITSEERQTEPYESPDKFPIDTSQVCLNGTLKTTNRYTVSTGFYYNETVQQMTWVQDAEKKRIYHRVGLTKKTFKYALYVFEDITFYQRPGRCSPTYGYGYYDVLDSFGLMYTRKDKSELLMINDAWKEVQEYEGEPPSDVGVNGEHPSLVRGYADMNQALVYGWDFFYAHITNFPEAKREYFFPTMTKKDPDYAVFDNLPEECLNKN